MPTELETEIIIDSPPETVKAVFMDFARYPQWNPFIISISLLKGDIDHPDNSSAQLSISLKAEANKNPIVLTPQLLVNNASEFRWRGTVGATWFLAGEHWFYFQPLEDGTKTRFVQGEKFTGVGVGLFMLMVSAESTKKNFIAMNDALKQEVAAKSKS